MVVIDGGASFGQTALSPMDFMSKLTLQCRRLAADLFRRFLQYFFENSVMLIDARQSQNLVPANFIVTSSRYQTSPREPVFFVDCKQSKVQTWRPNDGSSHSKRLSHAQASFLQFNAD